MKKRLVCVLMAIIIAFSMAFSASAAYVRPGGSEFELSFDKIIESENVVASSNQIAADGEGYVTFDYYVTLDAKNIEISYKDAEGAKIAVLPDGDREEAFSLSDGTGTVTYDFKPVQLMGDNYLTLRFSGNVVITSVKLNAMELPAYNTWDPNMIELTENERAIATAVIIKTDANAIIVKGGKRYVNLENINEVPMNIDGTVYLPIKTLARALGYYHEEMPDKDYCLMRKEQLSFIYRDGAVCKQEAHGELIPAEVKPVLSNGHYYMPVRYFAESLGLTVRYKDGIIVIDGRNRSKDILNTSSVFEYVKKELAPFTQERVTGKTYYVAQSENANDNNDGSESAPFRTLKKAGEAAKAGDTVIVREGVYREILEPQNDGTPTSPITFKAAEGESVTISACDEITKFEALEDGMVAATLPWDLGDGRNQIFYNGECLREARYPNEPGHDMGEHNEPLSDLWPTKGDFRVQPSDSTIVKSDTLLNQDEKDYWKDATIASMHGYGWGISLGKVIASKKGELKIGDLAYRWWYDAKEDDKLSYAYLTGSINCIDLPGEWITKNDVIYMMPPSGETAQSLKLDVKRRQQVINLDNRSSVHIKGFKTVGGSIVMRDSSMCVLDGMDISYISHYTWADNTREGIITNGSMKAVKENPADTELVKGELGIYIAGTDNHFINSRIDHSAGAGLILTGVYAYIENNIISNCGYMCGYTGGLLVGNQLDKPENSKRGGFAVYNNTVYRSGRSVLNIQNAEGYWEHGDRLQYLPYEIAYNDFHDGNLFSLDTGITYEYQMCAASEYDTSKMHNNYVYYTLSETNPYSFGLYHDGYTEGVDTYENIVFCTEKDVVFTSAYLYTNPTYSPHICWNNKELKNDPVPGGPANLRIDQYPMGLPFYAGSTLDAEPFMKNYNGEERNYELYTPTSVVTANGEAKAVDGVAYLNSGEYAVVENVDFGNENINTYEMYFGAELFSRPAAYHKMNYAIGFGTSYETADFYLNDENTRSDKLERLTSTTGNINDKNGVMNVYIRNTDSAPITIAGLTFKHSDIVQTVHDGKDIIGGMFNRIDFYSGTKPSAVYDDVSRPHVKDLWDGTTIRYQQVVVPEGAKVFYMNAGTSGEYAGQEVTFSYNVIGDAGNIELGKFITKDNGWETKDDTQYIILDKAVPSDNPLDIYVKFRGWGTFNLYNFGFLTEIPDELK